MRPALHLQTICVPKDSARYDASVPCEKVAAGFPWVWQHGNTLRFGWRNASAASHLLGMNIGWGEKGTSSGGLSGRVAWLVANGYTDSRIIPSAPADRLYVMARAEASAAQPPLTSLACPAPHPKGLASGRRPSRPPERPSFPAPARRTTTSACGRNRRSTTSPVTSSIF